MSGSERGLHTAVQPTGGPGEQPITCVQEAGDFVYVPAAWGHTALNLEDSIGIAIGFRDAFATPMYINDQW